MLKRKDEKQRLISITLLFFFKEPKWIWKSLNTSDGVMEHCFQKRFIYLFICFLQQSSKNAVYTAANSSQTRRRAGEHCGALSSWRDLSL